MDHESGKGHRNYLRFAAMITTSTVVMFGLMYANTYALEHVRWSEMRFYMGLLMGATMIVVMLGYMWGMYKDRRLNVAIIAGAVVFGGVSLWLARSQALVNDTDYMRAMIPHHSIAILTSERAGIEDVRVQELAQEIADAQRREIAEMEWLIEDIAENGPATTEDDAEARPVPEFEPGS